MTQGYYNEEEKKGFCGGDLKRNPFFAKVDRKGKRGPLLFLEFCRVSNLRMRMSRKKSSKKGKFPFPVLFFSVAVYVVGGRGGA